MKRREFLTGVAAAALPLAARAQQKELPRIGKVMTPAESDPESQTRIAAFRDALQKLGWVDGQNLRLDFRWGGGDSVRIKADAEELVRLAPRVIVANGTPAGAAASQLTREIPIVFAQVMAPVGRGYIDSFARPGRNVTGFTFMEFSLIGKWLDMLKGLAPGTRRAAFIDNPGTTPYWTPWLRSDEAVAVSKTVRLVDTPVRTAA